MLRLTTLFTSACDEESTAVHLNTLFTRSCEEIRKHSFTDYAEVLASVISPKHSLEILAFILLFGSLHFSRDRLALEQFSFLDYGIADCDGSSL